MTHDNTKQVKQKTVALDLDRGERAVAQAHESILLKFKTRYKTPDNKSAAVLANSFIGSTAQFIADAIPDFAVDELATHFGDVVGFALAAATAVEPEAKEMKDELIEAFAAALNRTYELGIEISKQRKETLIQ